MQLTVSQQEAQIIITALQKSDPMGVYCTDFIKRLIDEGNSQLVSPENSEVNAPKDA